MTGGWAATSTLREALAIAWPEGDHDQSWLVEEPT